MGPDIVSPSARRKGGNQRRGSTTRKSGSSNRRRGSMKERVEEIRVRQGTVFGSVASSAPVISDDWGVPNLSDTLFAHCKFYLGLVNDNGLVSFNVNVVL